MDGIEKGIVSEVWHSSLQAEGKEEWLEKQMEGGWNACFSFMVRMISLINARGKEAHNYIRGVGR